MSTHCCIKLDLFINIVSWCKEPWVKKNNEIYYGLWIGIAFGLISFPPNEQLEHEVYSKLVKKKVRVKRRHWYSEKRMLLCQVSKFVFTYKCFTYVTSKSEGHIEQNFPLGNVASPAVSPFKARCGWTSFECPICSTTFLFDRRAKRAPRWSSWLQLCSRKASYAEVCHLFPPPPAFIIFTATRYFSMEEFWEKEHLHWSHFLSHKHTLRVGLKTAMKCFCFSSISNSASFLALTPSTTKHAWYFL